MARKTRWFPSDILSRVLPAAAVEALRQTHINVDIKTISQMVTVRSDDAGVFSAFNADLIVQFLTNDVQIASATIHGVLDTGTGTFTLTNTAVTGELVTVAYYGNTTDSARAEVTHTSSGKIATAAFSAVDQSAGGSTPGTISSGGGGGGGGGSK